MTQIISLLHIYKKKHGLDLVVFNSYLNTMFKNNNLRDYPNCNKISVNV